MSTKYSTVRKYYVSGLWSAAKVANAVIKGWITEEEYEEITGETYSGE